MTGAATNPSAPTIAGSQAPRSEQVRTALSSSSGVRTRSFVESLRDAETLDDPQKRADAEARAAAEEFVAVALVQPILTQLRESNNAWGPFAPGAHEKQFGALLDAEYASRIARASGFGLVDRLANDLRRVASPAQRVAKPSPITTTINTEA
ncbi:MAG: rod-binding protein [Planctomycetota bacterium]